MTHYTSIEQSKHLMELGLSAETADMHYPMLFGRAIDGGSKRLSDFPNTIKPIGIEDLPCWSIGALLELMPESYQLTRGKDNKCQFMLFHILIHDWFNTPLEAVYNMVCYLLKNGYIKKET